MTLSTEAQKLLAAAESAADESISLLSELLRFSTVNDRTAPEKVAHCKEQVKQCFACLEAWAGANGFEFRNYDDLVCVLERPGATEETIGVALHVDVVPVSEGWKRGAFSGDVADGCVWGRGAQDDKGPVAQTLAAAKILVEQGVPFKRGLKFIVGSTEETGEWECVERYLQEEPDPDFTVVPDALFPIISGEKGFVTLVLKGAWEGAEAPVRPGGLRFVSLKGGRAENIIPAQAELVCAGDISHRETLRETAELFARGRGRTVRFAAESDGNGGTLFHFKILGQAVHSSLPGRGQNAALDGLALANLLFGKGSEATRASHWLYQATRDPDGSGMGAKASHHFVGDTTVALTTLDLNPNGLSAQVNVRCAVGQATGDILRIARASHAAETTAPAISIDRKKGFREPIYVDAEEFGSYIEALRKSYTDIQNRPAKLMPVGGTTFAKAFGRAVCFGPVDPADGEPELAHQPNERVRVDHHLRNLKIYTLALARLVSADPEL